MKSIRQVEEEERMRKHTEEDRNRKIGTERMMDRLREQAAEAFKVRPLNKEFKPDPDGILFQAEKLVTGDRQEVYGDPVENWDRTARMFAAYLRIEVTARQAADLMILVKMSRLANGHHKDSYRDVAGYALVADIIGE